VRPPLDLTEEEQVAVDQMRSAAPEIRIAYALAQDFMVNRLKLIRRTMYGRAGFDRARQRVLVAVWTSTPRYWTTRDGNGYSRATWLA
jgi:hypothetical protein